MMPTTRPGQEIVFGTHFGGEAASAGSGKEAMAIRTKKETIFNGVHPQPIRIPENPLLR